MTISKMVDGELRTAWARAVGPKLPVSNWGCLLVWLDAGYLLGCVGVSVPWWTVRYIRRFCVGEKIQGALVARCAHAARRLPIVVDQLFPEAALFCLGYSGLDSRRLYHYGSGCAPGRFFLATELSCQADTPENENGVALVLVAWERGWSVIGVSNPSQSLIRTPGAPRIVADGRGPCGPRPDQHA